MSTTPPSALLLHEFGVSGRPQALAGGQRTVWRVGELVFKQLDCSSQFVQWQGEVLGRVGGAAGVRVAPPVRSVSGDWMVQGWTAWRHRVGQPAWGQWQQIIAVGHAFHLAVQNEPQPSFLDDRDDVWARADHMVWDLAAVAPGPELAAAFDARRPVDLPAQIVHGDLSGNVLISHRDGPAVIDFSPYWRPAAWATSVVVADAMLFAHADPSVVFDAARAGTGTAPSGQVLLRAVLFRFVTAVLLGRRPCDDPAHLRVLDLVSQLATSDS